MNVFPLRPTKRYVSDMGQANEMTVTGTKTGEQQETMHLPRFGIWEDGGHHHKPEVIATGDDLVALCKEHGVDPATVCYMGPKHLPLAVLTLVGPQATTLADGEALYARIALPLRAGATVTLDFAGVEAFAPPFFNAGIGRLLSDLPLAVIDARLVCTFLPEAGVQVLRNVLQSAAEYFVASPEQRIAIDRIVQGSAHG
jgi:hypothetical protein